MYEFLRSAAPYASLFVAVLAAVAVLGTALPRRGERADRRAHAAWMRERLGMSRARPVDHPRRPLLEQPPSATRRHGGKRVWGSQGFPFRR